jgi:hypothetical protein
MADQIKVVEVVTEEVTSPRNDGTPGSGLYAVPLRLSARPPSRWGEFFRQAWDRPPQFTTMHRPGIARVSGDQVILDGTTMEEVEKYHLETVRLAVEVANRWEAEAEEKDREHAEREKAEEEAHRRSVEEVAGRLKFDE